jgi:hypothetical protein
MLNLCDHQGNANQNIEIPPHSNQSGYYQEQKLKKTRTITNTEEDVGQEEPSYTACENVD